MKKQKYYVVWNGVNTGVFNSWEECQLQTKGFKGAIFKSFDSLEDANEAFNCGPQNYVNHNRETTDTIKKEILKEWPKEVILNSIAVDAACSGNPGMMEYQGVYTATKQQLFHFGPTFGTNNIGEFLAIVHALAYFKQKKIDLPIYSDSKIAINWIEEKKCKTKLPLDDRTKGLFELIERAEKWLRENEYHTPIHKWETAKWGEIPADFGRK